MAIEKEIAKLFNLTEKNWQRHSNSLIVWTRNLSLPLLILPFWSREWLGWYCLMPIAIAVFWTWITPKLFRLQKAPRTGPPGLFLEKGCG